jgi:rare lipoprotein A
MRRFVLVLCLSGLALALAACASHPPPPPVAPSQAPAQQGVYKVGSPYQINGIWYYPGEDLSYDETGIASWYGEEFHGKYTANGEIFDLNGLTAAHHTLPMPSIVQVTNLENGRTLKLRINDRGPFARGRIIDLSRRAAQLLGFEMAGTAKVRVQVLVPDSIQAKLVAQRASGQSVVAESAPAHPVAAVAAEKLPVPPTVRIAANEPPPTPSAPPPQPALAAAAVQTAPVAGGAAAARAAPAPAAVAPALPEQVATVAVRPTNIYVQAGAFARADNAQRLQAKLAKFGTVRVTDATVHGANLYRVRIGPLPSVNDADQLLDRVFDSGVTEARIVVD